MMPAPLRSDELTAVTEDVSQRIRLLTTSQIHSIAFVHALEVGVAELLARRRPR